MKTSNMIKSAAVLLFVLGGVQVACAVNDVTDYANHQHPAYVGAEGLAKGDDNDADKADRQNGATANTSAGQAGNITGALDSSPAAK